MYDNEDGDEDENENTSLREPLGRRPKGKSKGLKAIHEIVCPSLCSEISLGWRSYRDSE